MNATNVHLKDGKPTAVTVVMSIDEAVVIAKLLGQMSPLKFKEQFPSLDDNTPGEVYYCLADEVFNRYWDDGVDGFLNGDDE